MKGDSSISKKKKTSSELVNEIKKLVTSRKSIIKRMGACKLKYSKLRATSLELKRTISELNKQLAEISAEEDKKVKKYLATNIPNIKSEPIFDEDLEKELNEVEQMSQNYKTLKIKHSDITRLIDKSLSDLDVDNPSPTSHDDDIKVLLSETLNPAVPSYGFSDEDVFIDSDDSDGDENVGEA